MYLRSINLVNLLHIIAFILNSSAKTKTPLNLKARYKKVSIIYLLQKAGEITIRMVNNSSLPSNIKNDKTHLAAGSKNA